MIEITYFQPSWFQIKANDTVLYVDPAYLKKYYEGYPDNVVYSSWPDPIDGLPDADLAPADCIAITHHHKDHCKRVTVDRLCTEDTVIIAPKRCRAELGEGFTVVQPGSEVTANGWNITAINAYNTPEGHSTKKQHKKGVGVGYCLRRAGKTLYHAGDTDFLSEMGELGDVDVAMLPIDGTFTMDIAEAVRAVEAIQPTAVIPMHNMHASREEFKDRVEDATSTTVILLEIGETYRL